MINILLILKLYEIFLNVFLSHFREYSLPCIQCAYARVRICMDCECMRYMQQELLHRNAHACGPDHGQKNVRDFSSGTNMRVK